MVNFKKIDFDDMFDFNCGGFALGTLTWVEFEKYYYKGFHNRKPEKIRRRMGKVTMLCVEEMLQRFPNLRILRNVDEKKSWEEIFLFRLSSDGDFHFLLKHGNVYYHKKGETPRIDKIPEHEAFDIWCSRYDGPIVIFAKPKCRLIDRE